MLKKVAASKLGIDVRSILGKIHGYLFYQIGWQPQKKEWIQECGIEFLSSERKFSRSGMRS